MKKRILKYSFYMAAAGILTACYLTTTIEFEDRFAYVLYADGQIINAQVSDDQQWRMLCEGALPHKLETCLTLFEDQYFYYHPGVNPISILHAVRDNISAGKILRGGSTLTMQLARIHEGNKPRTYRQKVRELFLSFALELKYSKQEILQLYAQHAPYGGNTVGYCAAAQRYYAKTAEHLSWSEAATLAVLPNAPSKIYPGKAQAVLINKRNFLLSKLLKEKYIDSLSYRLAVLEHLPQQSHTFPSIAPHLLQACKKKSASTYNFKTTLDQTLQTTVNRLTQTYRDRYAMTFGIDNVAALVLRNDGSIAAYVGNALCKADCASEVDILLSSRSPGSTLKPFLYTAAIHAGMLTAQSLLEDIPVFYNGYSPSNFDKKYRGVIDAESALTQSLNVPAVQLLKDYGIASFYDDLQTLQFSTIKQSPDHYGLTMILGGSEVTGVDLATAYMNLVRTAQRKEATTLKYLQTEEQSLGLFPYSPAASYTVVQMLKGVNRPESQDGWKYFVNQKEISWKTGTSFGFRDAWSVGVTADYTVLVWVGNADGEGKPGLTGIEKAAPILFDIFDLLPTGDPIYQPLSGFVTKKICKESGYLATSACGNAAPELLPQSNQVLPSCEYHRMVSFDKTLQYRAYQSCAEEVVTRSQFVLSPIVDSYYQKYSGKSYQLPPFLPGCQESSSELNIVYPSDRAEILLPRDIDDEKQSLIGKAIVGSESDSLFWFVDHQLLAVTSAQHKLPLDLEPGPHLLTVVSSSGLEKSHAFTVVE